MLAFLCHAANYDWQGYWVATLLDTIFPRQERLMRVLEMLLGMKEGTKQEVWGGERAGGGGVRPELLDLAEG